MINTGPVTAHTVLLNLVPATMPYAHKKQNFFFSASKNANGLNKA